MVPLKDVSLVSVEYSDIPRQLVAHKIRQSPFFQMLEDERVNQTVFDLAKQEFRENPDGDTLDVVMKRHQVRAEKLILNMRAKQAGHPYFSIYCR